MAGPVSVQADIGTLSIRGLAAFSSFLEAFSMDNVAPAAVLQMEALGGSFLISGKYAECLPDYLQRHTHTPIGRMALSVGWRKGDTSAIVASSAGGQAIALLCLCLFSLYRLSDAGALLLRLSQNVLPASKAISSVSQLVEVGRLLQAKLEALGFGNELASQVLKVHDEYDAIGQSAPSDLLELITGESMTNLLEAISKALRDPEKIVRIRGTRGLGQTLALMMTLFPDDTVVTIEGRIIHEGRRQRILLAIGSEFGPGSQFGLETRLTDRRESFQSLSVVPNAGFSSGHCSFVWENWIAQWLQLEFLTFGLRLPTELLVCYSNILVHIPGVMRSDFDWKTSTPLPPYGLLDRTDVYHLQRIHDCSQKVLGIQPSESIASLSELYIRFADAAEKALIDLPCSCTETRCSFRDGWRLNPKRKRDKQCQKRRLWSIAGSALDYLVWSLLVVPGSNATVRSPQGGEQIINALHKALHLKDSFLYGTCGTVYSHTVTLFSHKANRTGGDPLGASSGASTIFPSQLHSMQCPPGQIPSFELHEGQFLFNGRYFDVLTSETAPPRKSASGNLKDLRAETYLSGYGCHSGVLRSIHEGMDCLELRTAIQVLGQHVDVDLKAIITASFGLQICHPCDHPLNTPVSSATRTSLRTTSVASPRAAGTQKIGIVQTQHNSVARLLACEPGTYLYRLGDCCLNCAVEQMVERTSQRGSLVCILIL